MEVEAGVSTQASTRSSKTNFVTGNSLDMILLGRLDDGVRKNKKGSNRCLKCSPGWTPMGTGII
jgi:hypothetical protein